MILSFLWTFFFFLGLPFIFGIGLPALVIPPLIAKIFFRQSKLPSLRPVVLSLIILGFFANILWDLTLYNHVYYEWDRLFLPYTFFSHESPHISPHLNWYASGWNSNILDIAWASITIGIYSLSAAFWLILNRKKEGKKLKFIFTCLSILIIISAILFIFL